MNPIPVYFILDSFICSIGLNVATESSTWRKHSEGWSRVSSLVKVWNLLYLVMDKNNFDDNNNQRYKCDHHHGHQDPNIIYKSLEQDIVNLILWDALQKLITCFSFFFLISSSISFCDLSVHSTNALSSIASLSLSISLKDDQVWSLYSGHTFHSERCDGSDLHLSWPPSHTLDSDLLNLATGHRQRQAVSLLP